MATEEIHLNDALEAAGVRAFETDLAELIIQLGHDQPSHLVVPALHKNRHQIREIFQKEMDLPELGETPQDLADAARSFLREKFLHVPQFPRLVERSRGAVIMSTREALVERIRGSNGEALSLGEASSAWHTIERAYHHVADAAHEAVIERFVERVRDYDTKVVRSSVALLHQTVMETLAMAGARRLLVPFGIDAVDLEALKRGGMEIVLDHGLSPHSWSRQILCSQPPR